MREKVYLIYDQNGGNRKVVAVRLSRGSAQAVAKEKGNRTVERRVAGKEHYGCDYDKNVQ